MDTSKSPYEAFAGNPITNIDPDGRSSHKTNFQSATIFVGDQSYPNKIFPLPLLNYYSNFAEIVRSEYEEIGIENIEVYFVKPQLKYYEKWLKFVGYNVLDTQEFVDLVKVSIEKQSELTSFVGHTSLSFETQEFSGNLVDIFEAEFYVTADRNDKTDKYSIYLDSSFYPYIEYTSLYAMFDSFFVDDISFLKCEFYGCALVEGERTIVFNKFWRNIVK